jgi:cytochrome oxidase assembly protein ShyY1
MPQTESRTEISETPPNRTVTPEPPRLPQSRQSGQDRYPVGSDVTLVRYMVQPRWIGALVFALIVAAGFAWLGQWQLSRAIQSGTIANVPVEVTKPLTDQIKPNSGVPASVTGQLVTFDGEFVPGDYQLLTGRLNQDATGYWVVGHLTMAEPDSAGHPVALAVARGFTTSKSKAEAAIDELNGQPATVETINGRLLPDEAPAEPPEPGNPHVMNALSVAQLFNLWHVTNDTAVYSAYVVEHGTPPAGLQSIYSPPPLEQQAIDWLNIFYAAEWAIFAGFAVYLWYRVVKDAWERLKDDEDEDGLTSIGPPSAPATSLTKSPIDEKVD